MPFGSLSKLFSAPAKKADSVIGIDFGSSSIKVVELKRVGEVTELVTYGELQLGPYAKIEIGRATNLSPSVTTDALKDILKEASVASREAGIAVPYAASFVSVIELPTREEESLSAMIPIEARKYVPVPVNQVTLDWFVIPEKKGTEPRGIRVLLAAIHNEALAKFQSVSKGAEVHSAFNEIEIFSTIRSSMPSHHDTVLIVDIGAATSKLYIVSEGIVQLTHSVNVGGQDMTLALSKSLEMPVAQAEEMKRQVGLTQKDNPRIERAIELSLERIVTDARRMIASYERVQNVPHISSVILSGGGAVLRGADEYISAALGRTIVRAAPFKNMHYPAFLEQTLQDIGPSFAVAVGVAQRRLFEFF